MLKRILWLPLCFCLGCSVLENRNSNINGIVATKWREPEENVMFCSKEIDLDTLFFAGSISKQFTGVLSLRHLHRLLEKDVTSLLSENEFRQLTTGRSWFWSKLELKHLKGNTVRHLLTHLSKVDYETGKALKKYHYQNLNFSLIGKILEKQTGKTYDALIRNLFREAGMTKTFLRTDFSQTVLFNKVRKSLKLVECDIKTIEDSTTRETNPAGGIVSSCRDLMKWNEFMAQNGYFEKLTKFTVDDDKGEKYGFGIATNANKNIFYHIGIISLKGCDVSYVSILAYDPVKRRSGVGFDVSKISQHPMSCRKLSQKINLIKHTVMNHLSSDF